MTRAALVTLALALVTLALALRRPPPTTGHCLDRRQPILDTACVDGALGGVTARAWSCVGRR